MTSVTTFDKNICPITHTRVTELNEPVIAPDGWTYEKEDIIKWLLIKGSSPVDPSNFFTPNELIPNRILDSKKSETKKFDDNNCFPIVIVWDISGSMSTDVELLNPNGQKEHTGLTNHDLVKHTIKTIIHISGKQYSKERKIRLSIITFSNDANLLLPLTHMDTEGMSKALEKIEEPVPSGGTNINEGLELGLKNVPNGLVYLLTDGVPNYEPPRGYMPSLKRFIQREKESGNEITSKVRTFGFGYNLLPELLQNFAHLFNGTFGFIPDTGFIGTVFVHALANDLYQKKSELFKESEDINLFVDLLDSLIKIEEEGGNLEQANQLMNDYLNNDPKIWEPEIKKAFSRRDWWQRWGRIYIRSLRDAHAHQECNNFKDESIKGYKNDELSKLIDNFDDIFCELPAPKPSVQKRNYQNHYRGLGTVQGTMSPVLSPPNLTMRSFSQPTGACFAGDCQVKCISRDNNGNNHIMKFKCLSDLKKGDLVKTSDNFKKVQCVLKTKCLNNKIELITLGKLRVTKWHPVIDKLTGKWEFPINLAKNTLKEYEEEFVYSFLIEDGKDMIIEETQCITLGHGIKNDPVATHSFWGETVIDSLKHKDGWDKGEVTVYGTVRDRKFNVIELLQI
jgi:uncharacterized protein YegL